MNLQVLFFPLRAWNVYGFHLQGNWLVGLSSKATSLSLNDHGLLGQTARDINCAFLTYLLYILERVTVLWALISFLCEMGKKIFTSPSRFENKVRWTCVKCLVQFLTLFSMLFDFSFFNSYVSVCCSMSYFFSSTFQFKNPFQLCSDIPFNLYIEFLFLMIISFLDILFFTYAWFKSFAPSSYFQYPF